ncbi:MAG: SIR2 family protein [Chitinophagaceae bacterium]
MLDANDIQTFYSLRELTDALVHKTKPLVFWIGAGASAWCNYPLWGELAEAFHSRFLKVERCYNKSTAIKLIESKSYPEFFKLCKDLNEQLFYRLLVESLKPKRILPVYERFIETLSLITPLHILTTNVDELLENNIRAITIVQKQDLERCIDLLQDKQSFVCKLHGSASLAKSTVFTSDEYAALVKDSKYLELMKHIFIEATIVFIGYGLADKYVLDLLLSSAELRSIFGGGSHFAVVPSSVAVPETVKPIRYIPTPHKDHRSAIQVLDEISVVTNSGKGETFPQQFYSQKSSAIKSAAFISDLFPPGTYVSSQDVKLNDGRRMIVGAGLTERELTSNATAAMHDFIVGLVCFDKVYVHITSVGKVFQLIGEEFLRELVATRALRFIDWPTQEGILYKSEDEELGSLWSFGITNETAGDQLDRQIRQTIKPVRGKEREAEQFIELLKSSTETIEREVEPHNPYLVGGLLFRPSVRKLIGMSGGTSATALPAWMVYPVLRLSHVVKVGTTCQLLGIAVAKLNYGFDRLSAPAFAASTGKEWADSMASYVLTGSLDANLGAYVMHNPRIIAAILKFRDTQEGINFRKEILQQLSIRLGGDIIASINAGLHSLLPTGILQPARTRLSGLLMAEGEFSSVMPAVWNNLDYSMKALSLWKENSATILRQYCQKHGIKRYDRCPCGSGEKLHSCCEESLNAFEN